jgi:oligoribonuclease NrnB/cAMP/cGMP phosphodiesterase (DHH superfamily)
MEQPNQPKYNIDKLNQIDVCIMHYPCQDGLGSAYIAMHYNRSLNKPLKIIPWQHGHELDLSNIINQNVLFTDISPSDLMIKILLEQNCKIQVLDHHITAKERMENSSFAVFDMNKSGTGLTWDYFYPNTPIPYFLAMLQDQDLWKYEFSHTKEFTSGFIFKCQSEENLEDRFKLMDKLMESESAIEEYILLGSILYKHKMTNIKSIVKKIKDNVYTFVDTKFIDTHSDKINTYKVICYNCSSDLTSELGNALSEEYCDFAVLWSYDHLTNNYLISLRSHKGICADIAKRYLEGGGHPNAAGGSSKDHPNKIFSSVSISL